MKALSLVLLFSATASANVCDNWIKNNWSQYFPEGEIPLKVKDGKIEYNSKYQKTANGDDTVIDLQNNLRLRVKSVFEGYAFEISPKKLDQKRLSRVYKSWEKNTQDVDNFMLGLYSNFKYPVWERIDVEVKDGDCSLNNIEAEYLTGNDIDADPTWVMVGKNDLCNDLKNLLRDYKDCFKKDEKLKALMLKASGITSVDKADHELLLQRDAYGDFSARSVFDIVNGKRPLVAAGAMLKRCRDVFGEQWKRDAFQEVKDVYLTDHTPKGPVKEDPKPQSASSSLALQTGISSNSSSAGKNPQPSVSSQSVRDRNYESEALDHLEGLALSWRQCENSGDSEACKFGKTAYENAAKEFTEKKYKSYLKRCELENAKVQILGVNIAYNLSQLGVNECDDNGKCHVIDETDAFDRIESAKKKELEKIAVKDRECKASKGKLKGQYKIYLSKSEQIETRIEGRAKYLAKWKKEIQDEIPRYAKSKCAQYHANQYQFAPCYQKAYSEYEAMLTKRYKKIKKSFDERDEKDQEALAHFDLLAAHWKKLETDKDYYKKEGWEKNIFPKDYEPQPMGGISANVIDVLGKEDRSYYYKQMMSSLGQIGGAAAYSKFGRSNNSYGYQNTFSNNAYNYYGWMGGQQSPSPYLFNTGSYNFMPYNTVYGYNSYLTNSFLGGSGTGIYGNFGLQYPSPLLKNTNTKFNYFSPSTGGINPYSTNDYNRYKLGNW